jgi:non-heme chloroperoxidase
VTDISLTGRQFKMTVLPFAAQLDGTFTGVLAPDEQSIAGTWDHGKAVMVFHRVSVKDAWPTDPSPHTVHFVPVGDGVTLEVLDWGGTGTPLIFTPGLGDTAHEFDELAPRFTARHHVYAISRRGTGASSMPPPTDENYNADRLGDDLLAVMAALHIDRAFLAGHSIGVEELSSIGTRYPKKALGLIYLDALSRAYYSSANPSLAMNVDVMRRDLTQLPKAGVSPIRSRVLVKEMLASLPDLEKALKQYQRVLTGLPEYPPIAQTPRRLVMDAIGNGSVKYGPVSAPALAIVAAPPACKPNCDTPSARAYAEGIMMEVNAYQAGNPKTKMVRLPYADHYVFRSNEADVLRAMNAFMDDVGK